MMSAAAEETGDIVAMLMDLAGAEGTASHAYTHSFELNAAPGRRGRVSPLSDASWRG